VKNIVICADGTGNTAMKGRGTNVFKLYEAVDQSVPDQKSGLLRQIAIYHDGVGTENLKWWRIFTGAIGWGLARNVRELYEELARVYAKGDKIYLFGFSRGAFTVRTLAELIALCGIPDLNLDKESDAKRTEEEKKENPHGRKSSAELKKTVKDAYEA
jgi:uncharacterized protein (DUF2235 family)